jgi:cell wall-associated NlpC family hydrolase
MTKNLFSALIIVSTLASCGAVKTIQNRPEGQDAKFIDDITYSPKQVTSYQTLKGQEYGENAQTNKKEQATVGVMVKNASTTYDVNATSTVQLKEKFAFYLKTETSEIINIALYKAIDSWLGTRYHYGGTSHRGVDCSSLMQHLYNESGGEAALPRTARLQHGFTKRVSRADLQEGDLIFFNTTGGISHVGMYLKNDKFVHASSSRGVTISDLNENYYAKRYLGAGRIL